MLRCHPAGVASGTRKRRVGVLYLCVELRILRAGGGSILCRLDASKCIGAKATNRPLRCPPTEKSWSDSEFQYATSEVLGE